MWGRTVIILLVLSLFLAIPGRINGISYVPGVRAGDWAEYTVQVLGQNAFEGIIDVAPFLYLEYAKLNVK